MSASLGRVLGLILTVALVWVWHYGLWTPADWRVPLDYSGDTHEMLTRIKAASEGDTWPLAPQVLKRLGAPWGAHWNGYPTPDKLLVLLLGGLARGIGVAAAANLAVLVAAVSAALAFYGVARRLRASWEWAFVGGIALCLYVLRVSPRPGPSAVALYVDDSGWLALLLADCTSKRGRLDQS
jgi:hypothetical protein